MLAQTQYTIVDLSDPIVSGTAPAAPTEDMERLETSAREFATLMQQGALKEDIPVLFMG